MQHAVKALQVVEVIILLVRDEGLLALRQQFRHLLLQAGFLGHELGVAAEQDVRTAAGHVGGDGDGVLAPRLRHNRGLALVMLGVQHLVPHAHLLQNSREPLGFLHRDGAHQNRLALLVKLLDLLGGVAELLVLCAVDDVRVFLADQRLVGGNDGDVEVVDLLELGRFGFRGARHAGQLLVHAEVVLEGDGGERLVFALDLHAFLGLHGLVRPSLQRRPGIRRPVNSSTMMTWPSCTT